MPTTLRLDVEGLTEIRAKFKVDALIAEPWHQAMTEAADVAATAVEGAAPRATGGLAASVTRKISGKSTGLTAGIVVGARRGGYPYPKLIEYAAKYGHKGFAVSAIRGARGEIESILGKCANQIERRFGSGAL